MCLTRTSVQIARAGLCVGSISPCESDFLLFRNSVCVLQQEDACAYPVMASRHVCGEERGAHHGSFGEHVQ